MDFFNEAIHTLEALVRAIHGDGNRNEWQNRRHGKLPDPHEKAAFNRKRFLCNRLKVRPCNRRQSLS